MIVRQYNILQIGTDVIFELYIMTESKERASTVFAIRILGGKYGCEGCCIREIMLNADRNMSVKVPQHHAEKYEI